MDADLGSGGNDALARLVLRLGSAPGALGEERRAFGDLSADLWRGLDKVAFAGGYSSD